MNNQPLSLAAFYIPALSRLFMYLSMVKDSEQMYRLKTHSIGYYPHAALEGVTNLPSSVIAQ